MRLFIAVDPGRQFRTDLDARLDAWRRRLALSWVRPDNLHVTLQFLGEQPAELLPGLEKRLVEVAGRHEPLLLRPGRLGAFPHLRSPRVLFLQMESGGALERLAADVRAAITPLLGPGAVDDKPFRPHLTLARIKRPLTQAEGRLLVDIDLGAWADLPAAELRLLRSELERAGARYTDMAVVPLGKTAAR